MIVLDFMQLGFMQQGVTQPVKNWLNYQRLASLTIIFFCYHLSADNFGLHVANSAFDYNYLDITGIITQAKGNGIGLNASTDIEPNFALTFSVDHTQQPKDSSTHLSLGVTYHQLINKTQLPQLDWVLHLSFEAVSINDKNKSHHANTKHHHRHISHDVGLRLGSGFRYQVSQHIDVYSDIAVSTTTQSSIHIRLGATYDLTQSFNLYSAYEFSDSDKCFVGMRYLF
ncbi:MAG: hypothetical protein OXE99_04385 [Cellvibrionales bacterium]|nr:hypothetical protein [Cellvibrionales bacterium]